MSFPIKGNDISSVMKRKNKNDRKNERDEQRDGEIEKDKSEFIEYYQYGDREYEIIKKGNKYYARWSSLVIGDKDINKLKNIKIPRFKDIKLF